MAIPAGHIITVGGLSVINRLQDAGLQNPKVPVDIVRETGNDLVVGKVLTEANFQFQMTSWDVSCDMMAFLNGKITDKEDKLGKGSEGPSSADAEGKLTDKGEGKITTSGGVYNWANCQFVNLASPWAVNTTVQGGTITSGVLTPHYYPTAMSYKFGVTANAEQTVTLEGGEYYQSLGYPIEEYAEEKVAAKGKIKTIKLKYPAKVYRIGGHGGEAFRHVFGVLINGVIAQEGVDYEEKPTTFANPGAEPKAGEIVFLKEYEHETEVQVRYCYFVAGEEEDKFAIGLEDHAGLSVLPAAVRGRNVDILIGKGSQVKFHGIQDFALNATHTGEVQRELGFQDPIGYIETGIDATGTITVNPVDAQKLYDALELITGIKMPEHEVLGYLNEFPLPLTVAIYNPKNPAEVLKSLYMPDAIIQAPGTSARVNTAVSLPISFESQSGSFYEIKGALPTVE